MAIKKVTLIGAHGSLGSAVLTSLISANDFEITTLLRESSTSPSLPRIHTVLIPDSFPLADLTVALQNQDALVVCFPLRDVAVHVRIAEAAFAAGVRRVIPADFGSVDARSTYARELVALFDRKVQVRKRLEELSAERADFGWTSLVVGHFFDWGLKNGFLHFWPDEKRAEILGDGKARSSLSTLGRVGEAVVKILEVDEQKYRDKIKGRVLMIQSFCVSQEEVLKVLEKVTREKWKVEYRDLDGFIKLHKERADGGNKESIEHLVFALGVVDGNWEEKEDFAMGILELESEDLEREVRKALGV